MAMKRSPKKDIDLADELRSTWEQVRDGFAQEGIEVDVSKGVDHAVVLRASAAQRIGRTMQKKMRRTKSD